MVKIKISDVDLFYGSFQALKKINMDIEENEITAFIGPSGCGKSTVLRTLDRMHEIIPGAHVKGEVELEGKNLYAKDVDPVAVRRDVGMVFQRPNPFPTMTIRENGLAGVRLNNRRISKSDADDLVEWALKGANLWEEVKDRLDNPGIGLSGGQPQRRCIARAVAVHPQVLLMDEPFHALDLGLKLRLMRTLKETLRGFKMILNGECDELPESAFLFAGTIDDVFAKAKKG